MLQVSTLRSAISYINCLKKLIEDCDDGLVDKTMFSAKEKKANSKIKTSTCPAKKKKKAVKDQTHVESKVKTSKPVILDPKWTNYSEQFLGHKFSIPSDINLVQLECSSPSLSTVYPHATDTPYQDYRYLTQIQSELHPLPNINTFTQHNPYEKCLSFTSPTPPCSSPRDVNEISISISLWDNKDSTGGNEDSVCSVVSGQDQFIFIKENLCNLYKCVALNI